MKINKTFWLRPRFRRCSLIGRPIEEQFRQSPSPRWVHVQMDPPGFSVTSLVETIWHNFDRVGGFDELASERNAGAFGEARVIV